MIPYLDDSGINGGRFIHNVGLINGNGTISASVSNLSGAVVSPGLSLGTNTINGGMVFGSNATLTVELGSLSDQSDLLNLAGNLTLDPGSILNISGGAVGNATPRTVRTSDARGRPVEVPVRVEEQDELTLQ